MEVEQSAELTGTNRSCGLTILLRQTASLAPGVRVTSSATHSDNRLPGPGLAPGGPGRTQKFPVVISRRSHPIPSRTRKLSSLEPMVLLGRPSGRVGRRRDLLERACMMLIIRALSLLSSTHRALAARRLRRGALKTVSQGTHAIGSEVLMGPRFTLRSAGR